MNESMYCGKVGDVAADDEHDRDDDGRIASKESSVRLKVGRGAEGYVAERRH